MSDAYAQQLFNRANQLLETGHPDQAVPLYRQAMQFAPNHIEPYCMLGVAYHRLGDLKSAHQLLLYSVKKAPHLFQPHFNLANYYRSQNHFQLAVEQYKKALALNPKHVLTLRYISGTLIHLYQYTYALIYLKRSLKIEPDPGTYNNLGLCYFMTGDLTSAHKYLHQGFKKYPNNDVVINLFLQVTTHTCDWDLLEDLKTQLKALSLDKLQHNQAPSQNPYLTVLTYPDSNFILQIARAHSQNLLTRLYPPPTPFSFTLPQPPPLNIGYVSANFRDHATSHLIRDLFSKTKQTKSFLYSYGPQDNSSFLRTYRSQTKFHNIHQALNHQTAQKIHSHQIHILLDLKGHTVQNRLAIFAYRPAPIQATYLGYPGTTGADFIDYYISDPITTPPGFQTYFSEQLIFMPHTYQINSNLPISSQPKPKANFAFAVPNSPYKIEPQSFKIFCRLTSQTPGAKLFLYTDEPVPQSNLKKFAKKHKLSPSRLVFFARLPKPKHLGRLANYDLALDTFTTGGHVTSSDCLYAGLPIVTLLGDHFTARVTSSLLCAIGISECITHTTTDYYHLAHTLSHSPQKLTRIRRKLAHNKTRYPLYDTARFAANLEKTFLRMWQSYQDSQPPTSFHHIDPNPLDNSYC